MQRTAFLSFCPAMKSLRMQVIECVLLFFDAAFSSSSNCPLRLKGIRRAESTDNFSPIFATRTPEISFSRYKTICSSREGANGHSGRRDRSVGRYQINGPRFSVDDFSLGGKPAALSAVLHSKPSANLDWRQPEQRHIRALTDRSNDSIKIFSARSSL